MTEHEYDERMLRETVRRLAYERDRLHEHRDVAIAALRRIRDSGGQVRDAQGTWRVAQEALLELIEDDPS